MMLPFLIGAATAPHQVEGNNVHSDFWCMEHVKHSDFAEPSGDACDHYHRFEQDNALLAGRIRENLWSDQGRPKYAETVPERKLIRSRKAS